MSDQPDDRPNPNELGKEELDRLRQLMREPPSENNADNPPDNSSPQTTDFNQIDTKRSPRIGNFKLLQRLGEGGMGEVWMADQEKPVRRRVAIKLIKPGMDSRAVLARFEAERQALALMNHPNIAKIFEAGIVGPEDQSMGIGRPYFVMELVKGIPITEFCDQRRLSVPARLDLFKQSCSAVHHAHQKGIIHRDLKPSNILVENHDDRPVLKVIDFGLAKAIGGAHLTEQTLFTALGAVAGTPLYMAPEQAVLNALDIDIRADIFSLGVLLYELLTGSTPLTKESLQQKGLDEMLKIIRDYEPPVPSIRLSTSDALPSIAAMRQFEPKRLGRFVRGDLDWIVMKALAKERERRYSSATAFSEDIDRFLNEEAVLAGPPSAMYQFRKFARRNRGPVIAGTAIMSALGIGLLGTTWSYFRAERNANLERIAKEESIQARDAETVARKAAELEAYIANLSLAQTAMRSGDYIEARARLAACAEELRGFEWKVLSKNASLVVYTLPYTLPRSTRNSPPDSQNSDGTSNRDRDNLIVSPDESQLIAFLPNNCIQAFDIKGNSTGVAMKHPSKVMEVVFSSESDMVATTCLDMQLRLWGIDGSARTSPMKLDSHVTNLRVSSKEERVIANDNHSLIIWDFDGNLVSRIPVSVNDLEISPKCNSILLRSGREQEMSVYDMDGKLLATLGYGLNLRYSLNGDFINDRYYTESKGFWTAKGDNIEVPSGHRVRAASPDGSRIVTTTKSELFISRIRRNALETIHQVPILTEVDQVLFSRDGNRFATKNSDVSSSVSIWDETGIKLRESVRLRNTAYYADIAFTPNDRNLIVQTGDRCVQMFDGSRVSFPIRGNLTDSKPHAKAPFMLDASDNAGLGIVIRHTDDLSAWDNDGNRVGQAALKNISVKVLPKARIAMVDNLVVEIDQLDNGMAALDLEPMRSLEAAAILESCRSTNADHSQPIHRPRRITLKAVGKQLQVHDSVAKRQLSSIETSNVNAPAIVLPDESRIIVGDGKRVRILDGQTLREIASIAQESVVTELECSPDGRCLIWKYQDGTGRAWDVRPLGEKQQYWKDCSSEFDPSTEYVSKLMESSIPTLDLMQSVLDDKSLSARRRWGVARLLVEAMELTDALAKELFEKLTAEIPYSKELVQSRLAEIRAKDNDWRKLDVVDQRLKDWEFRRYNIVSFCEKILLAKNKAASDYEKAFDASQVAVQIDPKDHDAILAVGAAHYRLGRYEQAREFLQRAGEQNDRVSSSAIARRSIFLSMTLLKLGEKDGAIKLLESVKLPKDAYGSDMELMAEARALILND